MPAIKSRRMKSSKTRFEAPEAPADQVDEPVNDSLTDNLSDGLDNASAWVGSVQMDGSGGSGGGPDDVHAAAARGTSGAGGALPHSGKIQESFGSFDVGGIKAHTGGTADSAAKDMGAHAFASGNDVAFASGKADLHTAAHEAAHIIQQSSGVNLAGGVGSVGDKYERHADAVADKVVSGQSAEGLLADMSGGPTTQMKQAAQKKAVQARNSGAVQLACAECDAKAAGKQSDDEASDTKGASVQGKAVQAKCSACSAKTQQKADPSATKGAGVGDGVQMKCAECEAKDNEAGGDDAGTKDPVQGKVVQAKCSACDAKQRKAAPGGAVQAAGAAVQMDEAEDFAAFEANFAKKFKADSGTSEVFGKLDASGAARQV